MVVDWENDEFDEYELRILNKLVYRPRICENGHYDELSLVKNGVDKNEVGFMRDALQKLVRLNIVGRPKKQNRHDYCLPSENYAPLISVLKRYAPYYDFIDKSICDMKIKKHG